MLRNLIYILMFIMTVGVASAQKYNNGQVTTKIITGVVVDGEGVPVAGAFVNATYGAETVETGSDGSYSIEVPVWLKCLTASYPGLGAIDYPLKDLRVVDFKFQKKLSSIKKKKKKDVKHQ